MLWNHLVSPLWFGWASSVKAFSHVSDKPPRKNSTYLKKGLGIRQIQKLSQEF
jgi:hypothetical protein